MQSNINSIRSPQHGMQSAATDVISEQLIIGETKLVLYPTCSFIAKRYIKREKGGLRSYMHPINQTYFSSFLPLLPFLNTTFQCCSPLGLSA